MRATLEQQQSPVLYGRMNPKYATTSQSVIRCQHSVRHGLIKNNALVIKVIIATFDSKEEHSRT